MANKILFRGLAAMTCVCLAAPALTCCSTGGGTPNEEYTSIADAPADYTAEFKLNVAERPAHLYAESTGRTYYVAADGSDSNDGLSESAPFATVQKVNKLELKAGDKVLFKGGDTFGDTNVKVLSGGEDGNPIYFGSYGEGRAKIATVNGSCFFLNNVGNIVIENLNLMMTTPDRTADGGSFPAVITGSYTPEGNKTYKNIYILNNKIHGAGYKTGSNGVTFTTVYDYGEDGSVAPDDFITDCYIMYNEVYDVGVTGLAVTSWYSDLNATGTNVKLYRNMHIDRNTIYNVGQIGAYIGSCNYSTLSYNRVYDTGINTDGLVSVGDCGLMTICCDHCEMNNNVVYGTKTAGMTYDGMGIDIDWNCNYTTVEYNHCYNNMGSGIGTMANVNSTVRYNRIENNDCYGNQKGQFQVSDFTATYRPLDEYFFATKYMNAEENLIINNQEDKYAVSICQLGGGIPTWTGNRFVKNHVINDFKTASPK
ncbi:MAG: right-handed parallel beta-helix repeat-containing protein, partial [Clostridia bacterium]|nr:right-handed parallel beta-helix repeat-containing protein [Clostridia bacterium]